MGTDDTIVNRLQDLREMYDLIMSHLQKEVNNLKDPSWNAKEPDQYRYRANLINRVEDMAKLHSQLFEIPDTRESDQVAVNEQLANLNDADFVRMMLDARNMSIDKAMKVLVKLELP